MVRPCKYKSAEERLAARRQQNCRNVKAWRNRKKEIRPGFSRMNSSDSSDDTENNVLATTPTHARSAKASHTPYKAIDFCHLTPDTFRAASPKPAMDLLFGFREAAIAQFATAFEKWGNVKLKSDHATVENQLMELSVLSSVAHYLGRVSQDANMLRLSYEMYHRMLQGLQARLRLGNVENDGVLIGIANNSVLTVEVMTATASGIPNRREWKAGLRAGARMVHKAGPSSFKSRLGLSILRSIRSKYHLFALGDGEPCLFDTPDWQTIPYEEQGKTKMDELYDIMDSNIKVLWRVRAFLKDSASTDHDDDLLLTDDLNTAMTLSDDLATARKRMSDWIWELESEIGTPLYTIKPAGTLWDFGSDVVKHAFDFHDKEIATMLTYFWFYDMILLQSTSKIQDFLSTCFLPLSTGSTFDLITRADIDACALKVLHTTEYLTYHLENLGTPMSWFGFVTMRFAMLHYGDYKDTSIKHKQYLHWAHHATSVLSTKSFLARKSQFVVDSIWGPIEEVLPGMAPLSTPIPMRAADIFIPGSGDTHFHEDVYENTCLARLESDPVNTVGEYGAVLGRLSVTAADVQACCDALPTLLSAERKDENSMDPSVPGVEKQVLGTYGNINCLPDSIVSMLVDATEGCAGRRGW